MLLRVCLFINETRGDKGNINNYSVVVLNLQPPDLHRKQIIINEQSIYDQNKIIFNISEYIILNLNLRGNG